MLPLIAHRALLVFAAASFVLHLLLLIVFKQSADGHAWPDPGLPRVNALLDGPVGHASPELPEIDATERIAPHGAGSEARAARAETTGAGTLPAPESAGRAADSGSPKAEDRSAVAARNQMPGLLQTRLSRHLVYPPLARERGWEGTVWLGLRVESDGRLDDIRLERSSGHAVLDHSALNSLRRIGHLVEARTWLDGRSIDVQLPVVYRLIEN